MTKPLMIAYLFSLIPLLLMGQNKYEKRLQQSRQLTEWHSLTTPDSSLSYLVVYPKDTLPAKTVLLLHDESGVNLNEKYIADKLARKGYLVVLPDFLPAHSNQGASSYQRLNMKSLSPLSFLDRDTVLSHLLLLTNTIRQLPGSNGDIMAIGIGWGGHQAFRLAGADTLKASIVVYGQAPKLISVYKKIACPVYIFYAENDPFINSSRPDTERLMKQHEKAYACEVYEGAQHDYMELSLAKNAERADKKAARKTLKRIIKLLDGKIQ